jgi:natural product biosynthesis luciferase-like monooxygenase protein
LSEPQPSRHGTEVAVIGLAGRFPGAPDVDAFWRILKDGREAITAYTEAEAAAAGVPAQVLARPDFVRAAALLDGADLFDPAFFGLTPREAEIMDPQHRLLLECAWHALEHAGYRPDGGTETIGVWAGANPGTYLFDVLADRPRAAAAGRFQIEIGNEKDHLATKIAYHLDLRGPALTVQTGCSTSLVAIHLAIQSLLGWECDMALAGGVSLNLPQVPGYLHQEGGVLSPDGHCRAFDAEAKGTVSGNGVGLVVLKRLAQALSDGDTIHAILAGSAVNNDGSRKVGYTAPSVAGQAEAIAQALAMARLEPRQISYVETHGTGTALGDPIEAEALIRAFGPGGGPGSCALGAVKTNIGHLNAAAGVAGLIKTILMLRHRQIPATLHFARLNPQIDFSASPFFVNARLRDWTPSGGIRRAGVSSFGIGGTNAHVIVEQPPEPPVAAAATIAPAALDRPHHLLVLSARTLAALDRATDHLAVHLEAHPEIALADVAYTLQVGRKPLAHRRMVVARDLREAVAGLQGPPAGRAATIATGAASLGGRRPVAFLFPGQGTSLAGAGRSLYTGEPVFRREIDRAAEILAPDLGLDLRQMLFPPPDQAEEAGRRLAETAWAQPALFAVEHALARLWMEWLGPPLAMLGHSLGEYVAACLSGTFVLEEALALVALRGRLMQETAPGAMLAVPLPEEAARELLDEHLCLAAVNGPAGCVLAGSPGAIASLEERLAGRGLAGRRLAVDRAFHSHLVEPVLRPLAARISKMDLSPPRIPWISNLTGRRITPEEAVDPDYWGRQLRWTVRFSDALTELLAVPDLVAVEIGPGDALTLLARRHPSCGAKTVVVPALGRREDLAEDQASAAALGRLWTAGVEVDWRAYHAGRERRRVPLPTYPFERQSYGVAARREIDLSIEPESPGATAGSVLAETVPDGASAHARPELATPYAPPAGEVESAIVESMQELFGIERIGVDDDFFDLGGHSLLAVQLVSRLRGRFQVDLSLSSVFEAPTVKGLAARIAELRQDGRGDLDDIEALLAEVERFSEEDLRREIARELEATATSPPAAVPPAAARVPDADLVASGEILPALRDSSTEERAARTIRFSLFFFSAAGAQSGADKYRQLLDSARFADRHGFEAIWTPERHFQKFGGLYPNPAVLSAALAMITERLEIRAGSLVLPLHNPIRVVEDWALLDNLSGGRVAISFATGWNPADFALAPEAYEERRRLTFEGIETVRRLWAEGRVAGVGGDGREVEITPLPRPLRPELPIWITSSGNPATWSKAAEIGANVLCGLQAEPGEELARQIELYRKIRGEHGHDPGSGRVTVMLHTYLGDDLDAVRETVRAPMTRYFRTFLAQGKSVGGDALGLDPGRLSERDLADLAGSLFERYFAERSLLGTPDDCAQRVARLERLGVDEIACLVDFGVEPDAYFAGLERLAAFKREHERAAAR